MSNIEASKLYETIIEEVISDSRQDFEDSGIDESTLQDLRKIWCEKLSQSGVSRFTWDDEQTNNYEIDNNQLPQQSDDPTSVVLEDASLPLDAGSVLELPNIQTDSQLSYNTTGLSSNNASDIQIPNIGAKDEYDDNGTGLMLPRINQTDGTFEFTIHTGQAKNIMRKLKSDKTSNNKAINQVDGNDDDDEDNDDDIFNDSDDINSDLDEGLESEKSDEEDGDQEGQIMLCLYDKVQRVKNKWKSNLKEGVANINGRDYVFQKATGESEW